MFVVGDYIVYGNKGVCKVINVGVINSVGLPKDKLYYTLEPVYTAGSKIFTPVDNDKVKMRPVMNKEEALGLIDDIDNIDALWILDEKRREMEYKEAVGKCDCRELVRIIKAIYLRKQSRLAEGKKVTSGDEKYFKIAEEDLYGELAIPLQMEKNQVKDFVIEKVKQLIKKQDR
jgi:CarD family transcriptional regulator